MLRRELNEEGKYSRLQFAIKYCSMPVSYWDCVCFLDEARFCFDDNGLVSLHKGSERVNILNSVPVCASLGFSVPNVITKIKGRIDTEQYISFLNTCVYPSAVEKFSKESPILLIHDHYPVHTATAVRKWLQNRSNIAVLTDWPRNFGDLMPLVNTWKIIVEKVNESPVTISSTSVLWDEVFKIWSNVVDKEYVDSITKSVSHKLKEVVKCHGGWTD
ncbi:uncharacterized protein LOC123474368 [Daphnia magna]|uniref:uncharacterized protein LOC123474368 n=1 Tax=Daphnia magna TaxID=35525 RepID=UPI001E1BDB3A|nr:uncharacterized protein LOC123474368 [Daphnia magna]